MSLKNSIHPLHCFIWMILYFRPCNLVARSSVKVRYHHPKTLHVTNAKTWRFCEAVLTLLIYYYVLLHKLSVNFFLSYATNNSNHDKMSTELQKGFLQHSLYFSCMFQAQWCFCQLIPSQSKYILTKHMDIASGVSRNVNGYWDTFVRGENRLLLELTASDMNSRWP